MCKFEGCGIFIKRDIQPRGISEKVPLSLLATGWVKIVQIGNRPPYDLRSVYLDWGNSKQGG